jgi:hypothetical protein
VWNVQKERKDRLMKIGTIFNHVDGIVNDVHARVYVFTVSVWLTCTELYDPDPEVQSGRRST